MSTVYLVSDNGVLSGDNGTLLYEDHKGNKTKLIVSKISQMIVIGKITITSGALSLMLSNSVDVVFVRKNGMHTGRLLFLEKKNTLLRHKQHSVYDDKKTNLERLAEI